jgi:hypothetical protein
MVFGIVMVLTLLSLCSSLLAMDTEITRRTLLNLPGVYVVVEELQPNIRKLALDSGLTRDRMQSTVVERLRKSGIVVLSDEKWLATAGRPVLYININSHVDKTGVAYNIRVELRQIVYTEVRPSTKTLAGTWAIQMAAMTSPEALNAMQGNLDTLVERFIQAYWSVNGKAIK